MNNKRARLYLDRLTFMGSLGPYDDFMMFLPKGVADDGDGWPIERQWPHGTRAIGRNYEGGWTTIKWVRGTWVTMPNAAIPFLELVAFPVIKENFIRDEN